MGCPAFTVPPHWGQKRTGASLRRWLRFGQDVREDIGIVTRFFTRAAARSEGGSILSSRRSRQGIQMHARRLSQSAQPCLVVHRQHSWRPLSSGHSVSQWHRRMSWLTIEMLR
jgi:hypothetical protein